MTGGRVVILGRTGRNFAAGMSGGLAYVLDREGGFRRVCNQEMVSLHGLEDEEEIAAVRAMIERHAAFTDSALADRLLRDWEATVASFVRVVPNDYHRVLEAQRRMRERGLPPLEAEMAAFEENTRDLARVGGT
jgi:glutamate synthase (ferredoxin)